MGGGPAVSSGGAGFMHLVKDTRPWYKNSRLVKLNLWICLLLITSSTNGYDGSMMNGLQSVTYWDTYFHSPEGGRLGLFNAIQNIGSLCAYPFAPYLADGLGRRRTIAIGATLMVVASVLQAVAQSFGMFIGARFLIGFGLTFAACAAPLLVTEIAYPTQRAQLTSMYNTLWYLGSIIAAWATFGTFRIQSDLSWRIPSALQAVPSVLQIFLIWFVPESPRWLVNKGREEEALKTLAYYHARGDVHDPLVRFEFEEIKSAIAFDRDVAANIGWMSFIKNSGNRRRLRVIIALAFFSQWSGNGLVSYYLNKVFDAIGIKDPNTQLLINGILNIFNFIVAIGAGFLCEKVGRRRLFLTSTIGMLVFWTLETVGFSLYSQFQNTKAGNMVVAMIFLYYGFYDIAFTPLIVSYTVEILPFALRAKGFTIFNFSISLSLIFNQYVNPIAFKALGWKYFLVYICWIAFEAVFCYFFIIETKGRSLEETAALFEDDGAAQKISEIAANKAEGRFSEDLSSAGASNEKIAIQG